VPYTTEPNAPSERALSVQALNDRARRERGPAKLALGALGGAYQHVGLDLPVELTDRIAELSARVDSLRFTRGRELAERVAAVLDSGKNPAADKAVQEMAMAQVVGGQAVVDVVRGHVEADKLALVHDWLDRLLAPLVERVEQSNASIEVAFASIAKPNLDQRGPGTDVPPNKLGIWGAAREAVVMADVVAKAVGNTFMHLSLGPEAGRDRAVLLVADVPLATLNGKGWRTALDAAAGGAQLALVANADELTQRVRRLNDERREVAALDAERAKEARRDAFDMLPRLRR